jgi:hypothetical protein
MLRNRKAEAQKELATHYLNGLRAKLEEARRFWRESVNHGLHNEIVDGNFALYEEAVKEFNGQCEKEGLSAMKRVAN